jgi:hypothetical protein
MSPAFWMLVGFVLCLVVLAGLLLLLTWALLRRESREFDPRFYIAGGPKSENGRRKY